MANVITYGTFDFFHEGHRRILERARDIAGPDGKLFVGVTSENYDRERGKLNVCQGLIERMNLVKASGLAHEVFVEEYEGQKLEDIQRYNIDKFVIGDDWFGKFNYLNEWCEVIYLPRTKGVSSTGIRNNMKNIVRGGIVGSGRIANRFMVESRFVSGVSFDTVFNPDLTLAEEFAFKYAMKSATNDFAALLEDVDVVYIATPHPYHAEYVRLALQARKHVLCEKPLALSLEETKALYALAEEYGVILQEALKTAFAPLFKRMIYLAKSGAIGEIRQINATFTKLAKDKSTREFDPTMGGGAISELASYVLCPMIKLLGPADPSWLTLHPLRDSEDQVETFATGLLKYPTATGVFTIGLSAKTEGDLTIAGTSGYIWVPSPWWKTEYLEIRNDMGTAMRRVFIPFEGDGLRYELAEFVIAIKRRRPLSAWSPNDSIALLSILIEARNRG